MKISLYVLVFLLANIEKTYLISRYFHSLYEEQYEKKTSREAMLYFCCLIAVTGAAFIKNTSLLMTNASVHYYTTDLHEIETITVLRCITEFICLIGISFYYSKNIKKNILSGIGIFLLFYISEKLAFYMIIEESGGLRTMDIETAGICLKIVSMVLICTAGYLYFGIQILYKSIKRTLFCWVYVWIVPLFLCMVLIDMTYRLSSAVIQNEGVFGGQNRILVWEILCFLMFYIYDHFNRTREKAYQKLLLEKENLYYENQLKNMEQSILAWKKLRHDFKNHMIVLRGMVHGGNQEQAEDYLNNLLKAQEGDKKEINTGNLAIDSMINYKILEAEQHSVIIHLDLQIPEGLKISAYILTVVLGNVIDNAIAAAEKTSKKEVCLALRYTKGRLMILVSNPYIGDLRKTEDGLFLTDKENSGDHGVGLRNVREMVEKNGGIMDIQTENQEFVLSILLQII